MTSTADCIANLCLDKFASLKKTGKPSESEWTVLSGIVIRNVKNKYFVVALCTGTKCLNGIELKHCKDEERGCRLSDSHAEVLARRACLRYLYHEVEILLENKNSQVFYFDEHGKIALQNVSFHFFSSQTPCGDCSIIPKVKVTKGDDAQIEKMQKLNDDCEVGLEIFDIHRTGAKCLENDERQDPCLSGVDYHVLGPLRTKPGRGPRTLSLSCSDKMAKWNILGFQGALLSLLIPPIYFETVTIGGGCPFCIEVMKRGLYKRFGNASHTPEIFTTSLSFKCKKSDKRTRPCPSSIIWCAVPDRDFEVAVDGWKQGSTKKTRVSNYLLISRKAIFRTFLNTCDKLLQVFRYSLPKHPKKITYYNCKQHSINYVNTWKLSKLNMNLAKWPAKPAYFQQFYSS